MKTVLFSTIVLLLATRIYAQPEFTHADTLRGSLSPLRTCYDVNYYDLHLQVDIDSQYISGNCLIRFRVVSDMDRMQVDLFANMNIDGIFHKRDSIFALGLSDSFAYTRDGNAVYVSFPHILKKGDWDSIIVSYSGHPTVAKHAPWDGGFVWSKDKQGNPWVGTAVEGIGASSWWPCKDHLSDKPDSMRMEIAVPSGLMAVCNGKLRGFDEYFLKKPDEAQKKYRQYYWFISYPINNYNVTLNIGKYDHFNDQYVSGNDTLQLDYYVMPYNLDKAKEQFKQVKPMLQCYEKYMGRYPFWRDGYKLVETPYLGMEHQSAIAYGNEYKNGYMGMDMSRLGLKFDYIIIHESAHEWWGNYVTAADIADLWIHEGFATYTESIYVGCMYDSATAQKYINSGKFMTKNKGTIIGKYGVNNEGDEDMYFKGSLMLNTLRSVIDNDSLWWSIFKGLQTEFAEKPTNTNEIVAYFNKRTGRNLTPIFDQYLRHPAIPVFQYQLIKGKHRKLKLQYQWVADVANFNMPIKVTVAKDRYQWVYPQVGKTNTLELDIKAKNEKDFKVDEDHFYVKSALR